MEEEKPQEIKTPQMDAAQDLYKGRAKEIDCLDLKSGQVYYLVVDNRTESFFKK